MWESTLFTKSHLVYNNNELGRGKCGEVFLGKSKKLNIKVAVKQSKHNGI